MKLPSHFQTSMLQPSTFWFEWVSKFIPHFIVDGITYPWIFKFLLVKVIPGSFALMYDEQLLVHTHCKWSAARTYHIANEHFPGMCCFLVSIFYAVRCCSEYHNQLGIVFLCYVSFCLVSLTPRQVLLTNMKNISQLIDILTILYSKSLEIVKPFRSHTESKS